MKFNLAMITYSGYLPFLIVLLIIYSLLSYAMGFNTHFTGHETGIGELIDRIEDMRELAYSGSLIFIAAVFYILPLTRVRNGRFENAIGRSVPLQSARESREYAHSGFYTQYILTAACHSVYRPDCNLHMGSVRQPWD